MQSRTEALLEVLGRLAADAQRDAEVVGEVLAAHGDRARAEDVLLVVEDPVGRAGAHVDDEHPALLVGVARRRAGGGVAGEDEVADADAQAVDHAHAHAHVAFFHRHAPEIHLETLARHADGVADRTVVQHRRLAHVEQRAASRRRLEALGRGDGVRDVLGGDLAVVRRHGDEALHALAFGGRSGQREVDLFDRAPGAALDVVHDLMHAMGELLEVGDGAFDDAFGAALAEAEHAGLAVDDLSEEAGGLVRADIDDGDEGRKGFGGHRRGRAAGAVTGTRRGSGTGEAALVRFWMDILST